MKKTKPNERIRTAAGRLSGIAEFTDDEPRILGVTREEVDGDVQRTMRHTNSTKTKPGDQARMDREIVGRAFTPIEDPPLALGELPPLDCGKTDARGFACAKAAGHKGRCSGRT